MSVAHLDRRRHRARHEPGRAEPGVEPHARPVAGRRTRGPRGSAAGASPAADRDLRRDRGSPRRCGRRSPSMRGHLDESVRRCTSHCSHDCCPRWCRSVCSTCRCWSRAVDARRHPRRAGRVLDLVEAFPPSGVGRLPVVAGPGEARAGRAGLGDVDDCAAGVGRAGARATTARSSTSPRACTTPCATARPTTVVDALAVQADSTGRDVVGPAVPSPRRRGRRRGRRGPDRGGRRRSSGADSTWSRSRRIAGANVARVELGEARADLPGGAGRRRDHPAGAVCGRVRTAGHGDPPGGHHRTGTDGGAHGGLGMSNGEIGAQLGTSVRTVGNQLQRVFDRLGVHSRHALAEVLGPPLTLSFERPGSTRSVSGVGGGATVNQVHGFGPRAKRLSEDSIGSPRRRTRSVTSRVRWHPPARRLCIGSKRRCQCDDRVSGARPCSRKWNRPPGRSTRRSSASARAGVGDRAQREGGQCAVAAVVRRAGATHRRAPPSRSSGTLRRRRGPVPHGRRDAVAAIGVGPVRTARPRTTRVTSAG